METGVRALHDRPGEQPSGTQCGHWWGWRVSLVSFCFLGRLHSRPGQVSRVSGRVGEWRVGRGVQSSIAGRRQKRKA